MTLINILLGTRENENGRACSVPTQKMPRLLTTSASAVRRLAQKAVLMGVDVELEEMRESQANALADVPRKWHLQPAFSVEFIAYVIDRERRIAQFRQQVPIFLL